MHPGEGCGDLSPTSCLPLSFLPLTVLRRAEPPHAFCLARPLLITSNAQCTSRQSARIPRALPRPHPSPVYETKPFRNL